MYKEYRELGLVTDDVYVKLGFKSDPEVLAEQPVYESKEPEETQLNSIVRNQFNVGDLVMGISKRDQAPSIQLWGYQC